MRALCSLVYSGHPPLPGTLYQPDQLRTWGYGIAPNLWCKVLSGHPFLVLNTCTISPANFPNCHSCLIFSANHFFLYTLQFAFYFLHDQNDFCEIYTSFDIKYDIKVVEASIFMLRLAKLSAACNFRTFFYTRSRYIHIYV